MSVRSLRRKLKKKVKKTVDRTKRRVKNVSRSKKKLLKALPIAALLSPTALMAMSSTALAAVAAGTTAAPLASRRLAQVALVRKLKKAGGISALNKLNLPANLKNSIAKKISTNSQSASASADPVYTTDGANLSYKTVDMSSTDSTGIVDKLNENKYLIGGSLAALVFAGVMIKKVKK